MWPFKNKGGESMAGGLMTMTYISLAIRLFSAVIPYLEEQAKKTPNPADDLAIAALKEFMAFANGDAFKLLTKV